MTYKLPLRLQVFAYICLASIAIALAMQLILPSDNLISHYTSEFAIILAAVILGSIAGLEITKRYG